MLSDAPSAASATRRVGTPFARRAAHPDGSFLSFTEMSTLLQARLNALAGPLRILEAGCGRDWPLRLTVPYTLTGLDLDPDALAARTDLHRAVLGDLRTAEFPPKSFDVIYSAYVLEHVSGAREVLERFTRWLAPGGLAIIQVPDRDSAYGFLTRMTPMWAHVMVYRHLFGYRWAGTPGHGPYPTYYDEVVSVPGLEEFCRREGLAPPERYRMCSYERNRPVRLAALLTSILSAGRLAWRHNNLLFIVQAPPGEARGSRAARPDPDRSAA
jgi:SAM-dependent methyltransferase